MTITAIDHVQVAAPPGCEGEARAFYGGLLGLEEIDKPPQLAARGGVWFRCGEQQLHIGVTESFAAAAKAHPALAVDGERALQVLGSRLEAAGTELRWDASIPGTSRFYAEDPWGNRLELLSTRR